MTPPVGYTTLNEEERALLPDEVVTDYVKGYINLDDVRAIRRKLIEEIRDGYHGDKSHWFGQWLDSLLEDER